MHPAPEMADQGYVYIVTFDHKTVKVGFSTDPDKRFVSLQTAAPLKMEVLYCYPGSRADERRIHVLLKKCHVKGEWFRYTNLVHDLIDDLVDAQFLLEVQRGEDYEGSVNECLAYENPGGDLKDFIAALHRGMQTLRTSDPLT